MLIANAGVKDSQTSSVFSAAAPKSDESGNNETSKYLKKLTYANVASILRSVDKRAVGLGPGGAYEGSIAASTVKRRYQPKDVRKGPKYDYNQAKTFKRKQKVQSVY